MFYCTSVVKFDKLKTCMPNNSLFITAKCSAARGKCYFFLKIKYKVVPIFMTSGSLIQSGVNLDVS